MYRKDNGFHVYHDLKANIGKIQLIQTELIQAFTKISASFLFFQLLKILLIQAWLVQNSTKSKAFQH